MIKPTLTALATAASLTACAQNSAPEAPATQATNAPRIHTVASKYPFDETVTRLQNAIQAKGMTVFAVIDHRAAARQSGLEMQPATVIVFGTPKAGTPLMVKDPTFALQLPLRVLVTQTPAGVQAVFTDTHALIDGSRIEYSEVENTLANAEKLIRAVVAQ